MKESLFDIFQKHRDCYDTRKDPTIEEQRNQPEARQLMADRFRERKQTASEYASSLIPLGNDWIEAVRNDVEELTKTLSLPENLLFDKAGREAYRDGVEMFLLDVAAALRTYGKGKFLNDDYFDPVTLYRFGIEYGRNEIQAQLSREDAEKAIKAMKQRYSKVYYFPDMFSMFPATWTVMGVKAKALTPIQPQKKADSGTTGDGMGSNVATNSQTPPAAKEAPQLAIYTTKPVGRPTEDFAKNIADSYKDKDKADIIQKHTKNALESMTDPKAVIALFIVYFKNSILKQCPTYWQTIGLLDIEANDRLEKAKLCPFGSYQGYDRQRRIYFNESDSYLSLKEIDRKQDNDISSFIQDAEVTLKAMLDELKPPKMKARKGA